MDQVKSYKLILMIAILLGVTGLNYSFENKKTAEPKIIQPLEQVFANVPGYPGLSLIPMDKELVEALKLDDHLFRNFGHDEGQLTLYIGYYNSSVKVGAAHDPLVCFQGQGWKITDKKKNHYQVSGSSGLEVFYATMTAERLKKKELIVYWFQVDKKTTAETFSQKLNMVKQKFTKGRENNAFVRINMPIGNQDLEFVERNILNFIDQFYPVFHTYVTGF